MHIRLIVIAVFVALGIQASAQSMNLGLSMGANFSFLVGKDKIEGSTPRKGIAPGILLDIPLVYDSYLEVGAIYSQQGCDVKTDEYKSGRTGTGSSGVYRYKYTESRDVNYVIVPITWKQRYGDFFTQAGPYAAIAINAKNSWKEESIYNDSIITNEGENKSFVNKLRPFDVGAMFSLGWQTNISSSLDLFVGASYKIGMFSVDKKDSSTNAKEKVMRNQCFSLSAGIFFVNSRASKTYRHHRRR